MVACWLLALRQPALAVVVRRLPLAALGKVVITESPSARPPLAVMETFGRQPERAAGTFSSVARRLARSASRVGLVE